MWELLLIFADEKVPQTTKQAPGLFDSPIMILLPIILLLYLVIVVLPGRRRAERERQEFLTKMNKGDEVLTIGGIYGTIISAHETKDEVVIKVDDGTRLRMTKGSTSRNLTGEENLKKAKEAAKTGTTPATTAVTEKK